MPLVTKEMYAMLDENERVRGLVKALEEAPEPEPVAYGLRPHLGMNIRRGWIFYWDKRDAEAAARVNPAWEVVPLYSKPPAQ